MISRTWKALRDLELYLLQQRKRKIVIYTNDKRLQRLLEKAHPNAIVQYLEIPKPIKPYHKPLGVLLMDDMDYPNPLIFKPFYRTEDIPSKEEDDKGLSL